MKKGILLILPVVIFAFIFFAQAPITTKASAAKAVPANPSSAKASAAVSIGKAFGGMITSSTAVPILARQAMGYMCIVPGISMTIVPVTITPTDYFIPFPIAARAGAAMAMPGAWTLGTYTIPTPIACVRAFPPSVDIVPLPTVIIFGTSASATAANSSEESPAKALRAKPAAAPKP